MGGALNLYSRWNDQEPVVKSRFAALMTAGDAHRSERLACTVHQVELGNLEQAEREAG
jgi:hypothetical protein